MAHGGMSPGRIPPSIRLERGLASALDQSLEALAILEAEKGEIIYSNAMFSRTFGCPGPPRPRLKLVDLFLLDEEYRSLAAALEQARYGQPWTGRLSLKTNAGNTIPFEGSVSPVHNPEGAVESVVVRLRDAALAAEMNPQLHLNPNMGALGALAGGVAHDFNNLIGAILSSADHIEMLVEPDSPVRRKLELIQRVGSRAKELTAQILNFTRHPDGNWTAIDLSSVVREVVDLLQTTLPGNVLVQMEVTEGIRVLGDPTQLHQVIMNLGINASQAMQPTGGFLSIKLQRVPSSPGAVGPPYPQPRAQLTVEDTGCGMDSRTMGRIFEPFFTTKEAGHGTGLGLSVVSDIIRRHGGQLQVSSKPGHGSSFHISLPAQPDRRQSMNGGTDRPRIAG